MFLMQKMYFFSSIVKPEYLPLLFVNKLNNLDFWPLVDEDKQFEYVNLGGRKLWFVAVLGQFVDQTIY